MRTKGQQAWTKATGFKICIFLTRVSSALSPGSAGDPAATQGSHSTRAQQEGSVSRSARPCQGCALTAGQSCPQASPAARTPQLARCTAAAREGTARKGLWLCASLPAEPSALRYPLEAGQEELIVSPRLIPSAQ